MKSDHKSKNQVGVTYFASQNPKNYTKVGVNMHIQARWISQPNTMGCFIVNPRIAHRG